MKKGLLLTLVFAFSFVLNAQNNYVNPMVGTDAHGHTFPGAIVPFGAVQLSPDTRLDGWDGCSAYHYTDSVIYGFSHTHLSGTGCSDYGDILIVPGGTPSTFSHDSELATPGYYKVTLSNGVRCELTASKYVGVHRYTFPSGKGEKCIQLDLSHRDQVIDSRIFFDSKNTLAGFRRSNAWNPDQYCAFSLVPSQKIKKVVFYKDGMEVPNVGEIQGKDCKAMIYFAENVTEVELKVAISAVDEQGAVKNQQEIAGLDFDAVRRNAAAAWTKVLRKIEVKSSNPENLKVFYTALYHAYTSPYLYSDYDGRYRGMDGKIHQISGGHPMYTVFSLWDTYRALHPLMALIDRKHTADFMETFLRQYREGGMLPVWELSAYETDCMIGYHSVSVILDAFMKEISDYDTQEMLEAMVESAHDSQRGRPAMARYGYIPGDVDRESVSKTLEYSYDDWCIAQYAKQVGNHQVYDEFMQRAQSYKNVMDENGFMHGKINGGFSTPFAPGEVNNFFTEANSWQYSTYVPHDFCGWVKMIGGREKAVQFLDTLFFSKTNFSGRDQADITGVIGQYAHGNEPSHHAAYLYNYLGKPEKTQEVVRKIMTELYSSRPDGLCGNEDCGQMSAWYVLSAMGFYPVCPGSNQYIIGYPMFDEVKMHLENGNAFIIRKIQNGNYIQSATLNGQPLTQSYLTYEQIAEGGELVFRMGDRPSDTWGKGSGNEPVTGEFPNMMPVPYFSTCGKTFPGSQSISISLPKQVAAGATIYYTLDGSEPTAEKGKRYTSPILVSSDVTLKAVAVHPTLGTSKVAEAKYIIYQQNKTITYITRPQPQYFDSGENGLIDNLRAGADFRLGGWQGFIRDAVVVLDLGSKQAVKEVGASCLYDQLSWILYPRALEVTVSDDGENYHPFGSLNIPDVGQLKRAQCKDFVVKGDDSARYVKIKVVNYGTLPAWHKSPGDKAWLFVDEVWAK